MKFYQTQHHTVTWWKLALIALVLILFNYIAKAQQQVIKYPGYISYWNPKTLIPDSVIYTTSQHAKVADREASFHATGGRINENADYAHSGYDQGHLCNASDENGNNIDEYNSFDQCNIYPQRPNCNRLTWLALENYIRTIKYSVKVKVYWHGVSGYIGKDKITIPAFCDKEIWYNGKHEKYSMPNCDSVNRHKFNFYRVKN